MLFSNKNAVFCTLEHAVFEQKSPGDLHTPMYYDFLILENLAFKTFLSNFKGLSQIVALQNVRRKTRLEALAKRNERHENKVCMHIVHCMYICTFCIHTGVAL
jgi:hypothetical protein